MAVCSSVSQGSQWPQLKTKRGSKQREEACSFTVLKYRLLLLQRKVWSFCGFRFLVVTNHWLATRQDVSPLFPCSFRKQLDILQTSNSVDIGIRASRRCEVSWRWQLFRFCLRPWLAEPPRLAMPPRPCERRALQARRPAAARPLPR